MTSKLYRAGDRILAHFSLESATEDDAVSVVGSFNEWVPGVHVLSAAGGGRVEVAAEINHPGDVHFRYLATGGRWFDDPSADRIDEYGSTLCRGDDAHLPSLPSGADTAAEVVPARAAAKKVAAKKVAARKAVAKKAPATKTAAKKTAAKKAPAGS